MKALLCGIALAAMIATASAQSNVPQEVITACTPDALRLCSAYLSEPSKIGACLNRQYKNLSFACRAVFKQR